MLLPYYFLIGVFASSCGSLIGLGGGFIIVPALTLLLGHDMKDAVFMSLVAVTLVSILQNAGNRELIRVHRGILLKTVAFAAAGAVVASFVASLLPGQILGFSFGVLAISFAIYFYFSKFKAEPKPMNMKVVTSSFFSAGLLAGLFGIGGGTVAVPVLHRVMHFEMKDATRLSFFYIFVSALTALITHFQIRRSQLESIGLDSVFLLALGAATGVFIGRRFHKIEGDLRKKIFAIALILIGSFKIYSDWVF